MYAGGRESFINKVITSLPRLKKKSSLRPRWDPGLDPQFGRVRAGWMQLDGSLLQTRYTQTALHCSAVQCNARCR
jgi:hypothetical protein